MTSSPRVALGSSLGASRAVGARVQVDMLGRALAVLLSSGCAAGYPPLECDPTRAGELAFGFQQAGAFFPLPGTVANGDVFLVVDHSCRFWVTGTGPHIVHTGVLDDELLAEMNADLLTDDWDAVDGEHVMGCCDGATVGVARDDARASAYQTSPRSAALTRMFERSYRWAMRLGPIGSPVTEGPVRLEMMATSDTSQPSVPWPLSTPLSDVAGIGVTVRVFDGRDAAALREARGGRFREGTLRVVFVAVDVVPWADENGCLRPFFPGTCSELWTVWLP